MGKLTKVLIITLIIIICFISCGNIYALTPDDYRPGNPTGYQNFYAKAGKVLGFLRNIGAVVSVLGIAILGIRYMLGSLEEKANYKETMVPFIIGIAMTVSITVIITIVQKVAEGF